MSKEEEENSVEQPAFSVSQQIQGSDNIQVAGTNASAIINKNYFSIGFHLLVTAILISLVLSWLLFVPYNIIMYPRGMGGLMCNSIFCIFTPLALILGIYSVFQKKWMNLVLSTIFIILTVATVFLYVRL
jgi:hypothetical protein